jgi:hypothetical protein
MKVNEGHSPILQQADKNVRRTVTDKNSFQNIMDQITSSSVGSSNSAEKQIPMMGNVGIVFKTDVVDSSNDITTKENAMSNLKESLDLIDFYAEKLADSSLSADNLSGLVEQLEQRLDTIRNMEADPGINDKLKSILSDVSATMGAEIARFKRGDYQ